MQGALMILSITIAAGLKTSSGPIGVSSNSLYPFCLKIAKVALPSMTVCLSVRDY
jgi:hypothetical protein